MAAELAATASRRLRCIAEKMADDCGISLILYMRPYRAPRIAANWSEGPLCNRKTATYIGYAWYGRRFSQSIGT